MIDKIKIMMLSMIIITMALIASADAKVEEKPYTILTAVSSPVYVKPIVYRTIQEYEKYEASEASMAMVDNIIECESNGKMVYGDNGMAYGVAQFWQSTFNMMKDLSGMYWLDYYSEDSQRTLLLWALDNNYGSHWTCYKQLYGKL